MTLMGQMTLQTTGRLGGAALLLAASASVQGGQAQKVPGRPASVIASVSQPPLGSQSPNASKSIAPNPLGPPVHPALLSTKQAALDRALAARLTATHPRATVAKTAAVAMPTPAASPAKPDTANTVTAALRPVSPVAPAIAKAYEPAAAAAAFSLAGTGDAEHALHLTVGHLMFLNTRERVRRIYIANPAVLDSYTVSPNQVVLTAKTPGLSSVVVWDENDQSQVYTVSSDINVDELRASMKQAMPNDSVQVEGREARVVLTGTVGTDASSDAAAKLAGLFAKDVANSLVVNSSRVRQVRLKVRIVEVDRSKLEQFGINLFGPGGNSVVGSGTTGQFPSIATYTPPTTSTPASISVSDPLNFFLYSFKHNIGATIKDLENKQVLQILAEPTLTTISGQKASFLAGGEFPFPVVQGSAGGTATVTVQFRSYGVKLEFTPVVNLDGSIALKVMPEVSALDFTNAVTISGYTIPALSTKRADTQVVLQSGQSYAISGLLDRRITDAFSHTPGIASVPVLGQLFKSKNMTLSTTELIVIVTPTTVDPLSETLEAAEPVADPHNRKDNPAPAVMKAPSPTQGEPGPIVPFMKPERFDSSLPGSDKNKKK